MWERECKQTGPGRRKLIRALKRVAPALLDEFVVLGREFLQHLTHSVLGGSADDVLANIGRIDEGSQRLISQGIS